MKKRVCTILYSVGFGGTQQVILNYFSHFDRSDLELDLVVFDDKSPEVRRQFEELGFQIRIVSNIWGNVGAHFRDLLALFRERRYDAVHVHLTELSCVALFCAWLCGVPVRIAHSHNAMCADSRKLQQLLGPLKLATWMFSTHRCACGRAAAVYLYGERRTAKGDVQILENAIDPEHYAENPPQRRQLRRKLEINENTLCIGHVGRFVGQKNHSFLLDIFAALQARLPDSVLLLIGEGDAMEQMQQKAEKLGLAQSVRFLGTRTDVDALYQAMDVFCLPSLYEGLPVVAVEAQASGLPCLMSDQVSQEALLLPSSEQLSLDASPERWAEKLTELAGKRSADAFPAKFDIRCTAEAWKKLYD